MYQLLLRINRIWLTDFVSILIEIIIHTLVAMQTQHFENIGFTVDVQSIVTNSTKASSEQDKMAGFNTFWSRHCKKLYEKYENKTTYLPT